MRKIITVSVSAAEIFSCSIAHWETETAAWDFSAATALNMDYRFISNTASDGTSFRTVEAPSVQSEAVNEVKPKSPLNVEGPARKKPIPGLPAE